MLDYCGDMRFSMETPHSSPHRENPPTAVIEFADFRPLPPTEGFERVANGLFRVKTYLTDLDRF